MFGLRLPELVIILVVLLLLFGTKKLPDLGESLGKGIRAFKKAAEHGLGEDKPPDESKAPPESLPRAGMKGSPDGAEKTNKHEEGRA